MRKITESELESFEKYLYLNEKSNSTVKKYLKAVRRLSDFLDGKEITKQQLLQYREYLQTKNKVQSINGALSAIIRCKSSIISCRQLSDHCVARAY